jgi:hypothetical protein
MKIFLSLFIFLTLLLVSLNSESQDNYDGIQEKNIFIKLKYGMCSRNNCPTYEITILGNGTMIYEGIDNVSKKGLHQKQLDKQNVASLIGVLLDIEFFQREDDSDSCSNSIVINDAGNYEQSFLCTTSSHGASTIINAKFGDEERKVELEDYFSDDYLRIKKMIIEIASVEKWIKRK